MEITKHWAIFLSNSANKQVFIQQLLSQKAKDIFAELNPLQGLLFSSLTVNEYIDEENRHGFTVVTKHLNRSLKSMSSGEQKKALLNYLVSQKPDYLILDNPFDNLDVEAQASLLAMLCEISSHTSLIQLVNRERDLLPFIKTVISIEQNNQLVLHEDLPTFLEAYRNTQTYSFSGEIPPPIKHYDLANPELIKFNKVDVSYGEKHILKDITWTIHKNEFWHLIGPNGSGKTTMLSMITGDNPKGYGQDLTLFGRRKGTGETVWSIKNNIGYVTPAMTDLFTASHTLEQMLMSGFYDSIGLYNKPSDLQIKLAKQWLTLIEMDKLKKKPFFMLSAGQQRMALVARAMVKHPPLLILDEAIAGLDDHNTSLVISLINKFANESESTILYVSHRTEDGLFPRNIFQLFPSEEGSGGVVMK
ncbi:MULTISPECIES: ATP-binding cassette domain-containing protein [unclassified Arcicella]|uniref:ATP-binding cassette domain-containing protein n=1 Tax=unclassified Arcicella TaxID=2644986 RepID=UPI00285D2B69|nr:MULTISPECIES: ATP-binding cassette domain-containing protein [unclassified Arcicella]MDR6562590.1 molybdate transport system ATP-binding protein [Arcicella sp. BE51]MDR6812677.1 molybdate transport system ATP-binding protein [Arcicella sp. BE140]MDR6823989.1 molybdate transport system ATP-binding protein [Arcicella sp. BE139]